MTGSRFAPRVLVVETKKNRALLRPGGSADLAQIRDLCRYVGASATHTRRPSGWVIPLRSLPDVRALAEYQRWVIRELTAAVT